MLAKPRLWAALSLVAFAASVFSHARRARGDEAPTHSPPHDVGPMPGRPAGDGRWAAVALEHDDAGGAILFKTVIHPDKARPGVELFVVAIDVARVRVVAVAGAVEPEADIATAKSYSRPAIVPAAQHAALVGAFNGGWKADHGHFGMMVDGVTLLTARDASCTVAGYDDDTIRIAPWPEVVGTLPQMRFFRQTPACLYARGVRHPGLTAEQTTNWGAAADGSAVIRRSAIGLDERSKTLFIGVSNAMTAPAIADGMRHAGAHDVAELDVNWSFPKFLVFHTNASGELEADSLFPGFVFEKGEYIRKRSPRDFFYLVRR